MLERIQWSRVFLKVLNKILVIVLTIVRIVCLPVVLIVLFLPIYTWRRLVSWMSRVFRPDLVKMVVTRSCIMAVDDWMQKPRCNLVVTVGFEGELNMDLFYAEIEGKVLSKKNADGDELHPELKQFYESWLGFIFWKYENNFCIRNHIRYYEQGNNNEPITTAELSRIEGEMSHKAFQAQRSPWEVLYIRNYKPDVDLGNPSIQKSLVIFRLHHGIADGYSLLNLLLKEICGLHDHAYALPNYPTRSIFQKTMKQAKFVFMSQYEAAQQRIECNDHNEWRIPKYKMSPTWFHLRSNPIPIKILKDIRSAFDVSFTGMLIGGISGGIRQYFLKRGKPVPETIHCLAPFPVPGHTTKLRNFYSYAFLKFPVGIENARERMETVEKNFSALKSSTTPMSNFMQLPVVGGLCSGMIRSFAKNCRTTTIMSNFPGPFKQCSFMDLPVTEIGFTGGLLRGNQGIGFAILSYLGVLTIRIIGCKSLFSEEAELKDLLQEIENEFYKLRDFIQVEDC